MILSRFSDTYGPWFYLLLGMVAIIGTASCSQPEKQVQQTARLVYIQWDEGIAYTHLAKSVLESKMDYEVTLVSAELSAAYQTVAENDADAFMESWQPVLHRTHLQRYGNQLLDLGIIVDSTQSGLVVPDYLPIDSINDLKKAEIRENLNATITGIEEGAGIMETTNDVIRRYELNYTLKSSSGPAMTAALKRAVLSESWIVVTGWRPHWMFGEWDLKFLKQDSNKKLWKQGAIHIMGRADLRHDQPILAKFLENMQLTHNQLYDLMLKIKQKPPSRSISDVTRQWMQNHPTLIESWIPEE